MAKNEKRKAARKKIVEVERALTKGPLDERKENVKKALSKPPTVKQENARRIAEHDDTDEDELPPEAFDEDG